LGKHTAIKIAAIGRIGGHNEAIANTTKPMDSICVDVIADGGFHTMVRLEKEIDGSQSQALRLLQRGLRVLVGKVYNIKQNNNTYIEFSHFPPFPFTVT
jgi:hypothetical protein